MKKLTVLIFVVIFSCTEEKKIDNSIATIYHIESETLKETREINVYLPPGYESSKRNYPVIYVMDGQEYFLFPIAYQQMLRFRDKSPDFIVVGINTNRRKRRELFYEYSDEFFNFLKKDLIPFVDSSFRTMKSKERVYYGWEMAGGLALDLYCKDNSMFSSYIMASPSHITNDRLEKFSVASKKEKGKKKFFYITMAPDESYIEPSIKSLLALFKKHSIHYKSEVLDSEDHYTTPAKTIHIGLSSYFNDYKPIRFYTLAAYDNFGGLDALRAYYKKRGLRYDISTDIHRETKHFLITGAMNENKFKLFEFYNKEFNYYVENEFRVDIWVKKFADYYLKNNSHDKALNMYELGLKKFPESTLLFHSLGKFYEENKSFDKARENYKQAIKIARENSEKKLEIYQASLSSLDSKL